MQECNHTDTLEARIMATISRAIQLAAMDEAEMSVKELASLVKELPSVGALRIYLGWYLLRCGRVDESKIHAREAVRLMPKSSKASLVMFHVLINSGDTQGVIDEVMRFLEVRQSAKDTEHYEEVLRRWKAGLPWGERPALTPPTISNA